MIVKSFIADSVAGALKMVRSELGGDAVVLKTRKLDPIQQRAAGGKIEVTACIDQSPAPHVTHIPATATAPAAPTPAPATIDRVPAEAIAQKLDFLIDVFQSPLRRTAFGGVVSRLFSALLQADMPEVLAHDIAEKLAGRFDGEDNYLTVALSAVDLIMDQLPKHRPAPNFQNGQKIVLVGPPGAGKTSLMGRLAGYMVAERKLTVTLTSLDRVKVSAPEELQSYASLLDIDHFEMPHQVDTGLLDSRGKDKITLIDTPAMNPKNREPLKIYTEKLNRIKPDRVIGVFSALYRTDDLLDIIRAFKPFKLTELAFTMTDQTRRLGGILAASILTGAPISLLGTGQGAGAVNLSPDFEDLARISLGLNKEGDDE